MCKQRYHAWVVIMPLSTCIIGFITLATMTPLLWWLTHSWFNMILIVLMGSYSLQKVQSIAPGNEIQFIAAQDLDERFTES